MTINSFLDYTFMGNTLLDYCLALGGYTLGTLSVFILKHYILAKLKIWINAIPTQVSGLLIRVIESYFIPIFYFSIFYVSLKFLTLSSKIEHILDVMMIVLLTMFSVRIVIAIAHYSLQRYLQKSDDSIQKKDQLKGISGLVSFAIWIIAIMFLLDNLGVKITAVVAGLGIGGIAVALAAQAVLGDLFSYFVIFFDKPFETGDFIMVGDKSGIVEHIGIKTTRMRALSGEQLVFSNTDLTNSRVHNYKRMESRRVVFALSVTYQIAPELLKKITTIVKEIITMIDNTTYDRGHFSTYGDSSLKFEFVYFVNGGDYNTYMDIQQSINLAIFEAFDKEGIEFAYPTQTLFIHKNTE
ncbi:mechanosensitive ion channel family protein [Sulfurospirillum diekertiae]|uniref:mechanosensitive ion channel family protein n=1 Tax=Sulfurospirillum diekertiae TaxID=1854492 RepID=UPI000B4CDE56|nr:mechanosensitive ion channel family protein [Sulfurospirillum diekertiae]ASC93913.1 Low conductance mechanosensitive channel YnaI [Sulfurospirillum diekertiae]